MIDQFFTPPTVAAELIAQATSRRPCVVFDPAMGNGALLAASEKRWDIESVVGLDIDPLQVGEAHSRRPTWRVGRADFLSARSRNASRVFRDVRSKVDVAVMNPPFSGRGMSSYPLHTPLGIVRASRAMAFAIVAFHELSENGELLALLPDGCIIGERDKDARTYLEAVAVVDVVERYGRGTFAETAVTIGALRVRRRAPRRRDTRAVAPGLRLPDITVRLVRGCVRVADASASSIGAEFVHTVHLQDGVVGRSSRRATHSRTISSAAVLIPRVGAITTSKVAGSPATTRSCSPTACSRWSWRPAAKRRLCAIDSCLRGRTSQRSTEAPVRHS